MKQNFLVLGLVLFLSGVIYPSLVTARAVAHDHKKDYTYGHYGYYGYHPIDIKTTARTGMNAVMMAAHGLSKIKDEIGSEQKSLESNLKAARKMTAIINQKIGGAVTETMKILDDATAKAKAKLNSVKEVASALGTVEDNIEGKKAKAKGKKVHDNPKKKGGKSKHGRTEIPRNPSQEAVAEIQEATKRNQIALNMASEFLEKVEEGAQQLRQDVSGAIGV